MKKLLLLFGIIFMFVLAGCGQSDRIEGTWVYKIDSSPGAVKSIQFTKESDLIYKGVVTYKDGDVKTDNYRYDKNFHTLSGSKTGFQFNESYTEMMWGGQKDPTYLYIKQ